jgi:ABC-2 type transport system ATP-binding protein
VTAAPALAVETRGLTKRFGSLTAVDRLDLTVRTGELYGFLGPNGAGKSTTLRMLCGILDPSEGEGHVLGIDLTRDPERVKSVIGYMSQRFSLYDDLTVGENLAFYSRVYEVPRATRGGRIERMVRLADLAGRERQLAGQLSGGYRQRLALACALVHAPRLIFLDEPTAGVDPVSRRTFWALIRQLADEGTTILVTTHYMDEAELCDTLGFIYQGKLIAQGSPQRIKEETFGRPVVELELADLRAAAAALAEWDVVEEVVRIGGRLRVIAARGDAETIVAFLRARGITVGWARAVEPSVEDVFVSFVDRDRKGRVREQLRALAAASGGACGAGSRGSWPRNSSSSGATSSPSPSPSSSPWPCCSSSGGPSTPTSSTSPPWCSTSRAASRRARSWSRSRTASTSTSRRGSRAPAPSRA